MLATIGVALYTKPIKTTPPKTKNRADLPEQMVTLHRDVDSMAEGSAVSVICMLQWRLLK